MRRRECRVKPDAQETRPRDRGGSGNKYLIFLPTNRRLSTLHIVVLFGVVFCGAARVCYPQHLFELMAPSGVPCLTSCLMRWLGKSWALEFALVRACLAAGGRTRRVARRTCPRRFTCIGCVANWPAGNATTSVVSRLHDSSEF